MAVDGIQEGFSVPDVLARVAEIAMEAAGEKIWEHFRNKAVETFLSVIIEVDLLDNPTTVLSICVASWTMSNVSERNPEAVDGIVEAFELAAKCSDVAALFLIQDKTRGAFFVRTISTKQAHLVPS